MSGIGDTLTKQVGPLPLGVWLLVGGGGLLIARQQSKSDEATLTREVQQVPVPVGAIASPDGAPTVLNLVVQVPAGLGDKVPDAAAPVPVVMPTPPPASTLPAPVSPPPAPVRPPAPVPAPTFSWGQLGADLLAGRTPALTTLEQARRAAQAPITGVGGATWRGPAYELQRYSG